MRTVLLIRHGVVAEDAEDRFLGAADAAMSPAGEAQIRALSVRLRPRVTPDAIYCSDLSRSRRTAELLAIRTRSPDPRPSGAARNRYGRLARAVAPRIGRATARRLCGALATTSPISVRPAARVSPISPRACCRAGATLSQTAKRRSSPSPAMPASTASSFVICSGRRWPICSASRSVRLVSTSSSGGRTSRSSPSSMETGL